MGSAMPPQFANMLGQALKDSLANKGGPKGGMMAFGIGKDEHGRRVVKAAKSVVNEDGTKKTDYFEKVLDPPQEDNLLPKEAPRGVDDASCTEIHLDGENSNEDSFPSSFASKRTTGSVREAQVVSEASVVSERPRST